MTMTDQQVKEAIQGALIRFAAGSLSDNARALFETLDYRSGKRYDLLPNSAKQFTTEFDPQHKLNPLKALLDQWASVDLLFQLTSDEIRNSAQAPLPFDAAKRVDNRIIQSYLFFAIELRGGHYTRTQLAGVTREINKLFLMPAMVLFKHGETLTLAIINRRLSKRDESKDVLEKVTLIKDIRYAKPHRAHVEILFDLSLPKLAERYGFTSFVELHDAWQKTLDTSVLNKRFFREVANWYFWAASKVAFPKGAGDGTDTRSKASLIRLLTRLIFVWFIKEKGLVPDDLFIKAKVAQLLNYTDKKGSTYYKAILQNLFFATLNQEMNVAGKPPNRKFRNKAGKTGSLDQNYMIHTLYRYQDYFKDPSEALKLFSTIPFLNGGLFECLDKYEGAKVIRVDGFSDRPDNELAVPDDLFFHPQETKVDLNEVYGTANKTYTVRGLIDILDSYKFTIDENTPLEEEIALDPELLGKVFENLLATYNPETGVTARKQLGAFYTPREIVNYMVDESLITYLESKLLETRLYKDETTWQDLNARLRHLLAYTDEPHQFKPAEVTRLIDAIDTLKVIDPACGSGAFPMGMLHKLVFILGKLDPHNARWKEKQIAKASEIDDATARKAAIDAIEQAFERNELDYGRKLYLIENCIFGVDILPIAVQIAKLRCFISLIVDQRVDDNQPNRGIIPLPNLETKFVAANTLIGVDRPVLSYGASKTAEVLLDPKIAEKEKDLADVLRQYYKAQRPGTKAKYRGFGEELCKEINVLRKKASVSERLEPDYLFNDLVTLDAALNALPSLKKELAAVAMPFRSSEIEQKERELADVRHRYMTARTPKTKDKYRMQDKQLRQEISALLKKDGWPGGTAEQLAQWDPYDQNVQAEFFDLEWMYGIADGFDIAIGNPPYVRQEQIKELKPLLQQQYECYTGIADLYVYFYERSFRTLKDGGVLTYISSNKYFRSGYGEKLRHYLSTRATIRQLIDFGDAPVFTAISYPSIILLQKAPPNNNAVRALTWRPGPPIEEFDAVFRAESFDMPQRELKADSWRLESKPVLRLLEKLRNSGTPLGGYVNGRIYRGIVTGLNEAFVVNRETRDRLIAEHKSSAEVLKPFLRGRDVKRWRVEYQDLWLIFTRRGIDIKKYPAIYDHLHQFRKALMPGAPGGRKPGSYNWYEIQDNIAYWQEFEKPKVLYPDIYEHQSFVFDINGYFCANTCYFIPFNDTWLCGLLNSKLIEWFYSLVSNKVRGGYLRAFTDYMTQVPIPDQAKFESLGKLTDKILAAKRANPDADVSALEREIDALVYKLYGLTVEEIKIVESG